MQLVFNWIREEDLNPVPTGSQKPRSVTSQVQNSRIIMQCYYTVLGSTATKGIIAISRVSTDLIE